MKKLSVSSMLIVISVVVLSLSMWHTALAVSLPVATQHANKFTSTFAKELLKEIFTLRMKVHSQFSDRLHIPPEHQQDVLNYYTGVYAANLSGELGQLARLQLLVRKYNNEGKASLEQYLVRQHAKEIISLAQLQKDQSFVEFVSKHPTLAKLQDFKDKYARVDDFVTDDSGLMMNATQLIAKFNVLVSKYSDFFPADSVERMRATHAEAVRQLQLSDENSDVDKEVASLLQAEITRLRAVSTTVWKKYFPIIQSQVYGLKPGKESAIMAVIAYEYTPSDVLASLHAFGEFYTMMEDYIVRPTSDKFDVILTATGLEAILTDTGSSDDYDEHHYPTREIYEIHRRHRQITRFNEPFNPILKIYKIQKTYNWITMRQLEEEGTPLTYTGLYHDEKHLFSATAQQKLDNLLSIAEEVASPPPRSTADNYTSVLGKKIIREIANQNYVEARHLAENISGVEKGWILFAMLSAYTDNEGNIGDRGRRDLDFLIEIGTDPTIALTIVADKGRHHKLQQAKILIELGADVNVGLSFSAYGKRLEAAKFFIELDADPHSVLASILRDNYSPAGLDAAAYLVNELGVDASLTLARVTLARVIDPNSTPAVVMERLIDLGANVPSEYSNIVEQALRLDDDPQTANLIGSEGDVADGGTIKSSEELPQASDEVASMLIRAINRSDVETITNILQEEALPVDLVIDEIGTTLLHHAASEGKLSVVKQLIDVLGANPNIENKLQVTVLDTAIFFRKGKIAQFLLERNAVSKQRDSDTNFRAAPTLTRD